jgi:hypothetical protein
MGNAEQTRRENVLGLLEWDSKMETLSVLSVTRRPAVEIPHNEAWRSGDESEEGSQEVDQS